ncbi:NAD(P)/FAD-dependent oxidoreductase [Aeromicrobium sp. Leaf350]|uniref:flavin-containing monooxygenase n=1 Tax=Aeromicrobium sp. Leaf350 TaxID=2876565 RepID=UPI001E63043D|nr:NAD(P)/FAD-dependent oxidoreductase [Aeromicrobium sp. Leaf350]
MADVTQTTKKRRRRPQPEHVHDAVIVGAGFGGMGAAIALRERGRHDLVVLEREDDLGGTWHVNRYPGIAVDIPSATYSYSFAPNPYWSRLYAPGAELKKYADHVAALFQLRPYMRFGVTVERATWDDATSTWVVTQTDGVTVRARLLLTATGFLSQPRLPDIPGVETFAGKVIHTAAWDADHDLTGEDVAVIGTGATSVQLVPEVARVANHLTVYQRTAIWVTPKLDGPVPRAVQRLFASVPLTQRIARGFGSAILEAIMVTGVLRYQRFSAFNRAAASAATRHLHRQVRDPDLRRQLTPDYSFGCKRPTFSNTYFPTFNARHVELETTSIDHVDERGIVTTDGRRRDIDTLVLATGFDLWDANFPAFTIEGVGGRDLGAFWRSERFQAYEGVSVPGFPNFFSLNSPWSYSGLSYFTTIESQMKHIDRLLTEVDRRGATRFEVTEEANARFLDQVRRQVGSSVFAHGSCGTSRSYYFNQHGEATLLRPTSTLNAFREAGRFPLTDYTIAA